MNQDKPQPRQGRIMLWILLALAALIIALLAMLYPIIMVGAPNEANIKIPAGATIQNLEDSLTLHFGSEYTAKVMRLVRLRDTDFSRRHGAYTIEKGENALGAMRRLTSGAQTPVKITINGFRSLPLLEERVSRKMEFPKDSLREALSDPEFLAAYGLTPENALALFVDDTYEIYWSSSARDFVRKVGENYRKLWDENRTRKAAELGMTPAGMMTIASITDEETNAKSEKGTIGRLYINRLNKGMRLQADPTVKFAVGDFSIKRISSADLRVESPYNTYTHNGLPPGPIRTTGRETVDLILENPGNNYLYMCAKEDLSGTHNFAATFEEHQANARRYRQALDQRGIRR